MADDEGPGKHRPKACSSLTFADLGDTEGFRDPGELRVYGLELTDSGYYRRAPVPTVAPVVLTVEPPQEPLWDLKLELQRPYVYLEKGHMVARLENQGRMLAAFVRPTKGGAEIDGQGRFYIITTKSVLKDIGLKAVTEFPNDLEYLTNPPAGSTIYLEVILGEPTADWVSILPGLSVKWAAPKIVGFVISNPGGTFAVRATDPEVQTKLEGYISLSKLPITIHVGFIRLLFTMTAVSEAYLDLLTANIPSL